MNGQHSALQMFMTGMQAAIQTQYASANAAEAMLINTPLDGVFQVNPTSEEFFWDVLVPNLQERKTGEEWAGLFGVTVMDPDGWRRHDLSFCDTKITMFDFIEFTRHSTCKGPRRGNTTDQICNLESTRDNS